jgi:hypothetical protein
MDERERNGRLSPEIYVYATNKNFLNLYDALRIDKVKIEIAGYDPGSNRQTGLANAWLDLDDARLLSHLICNRLFAGVTGGRWEKYGGSQRDDGHIESRVFSVEWDEGDNGRFSRFPYRVNISNGPGKRTATGGVAPDGTPTAQMSMRLPELDMIKTMLALGAYLAAYEAAHHHRIVADRMRELRDKLAGRADREQVLAKNEPVPATARPAAGQPNERAARVAAGGPATLQAIPGGARRPAPDREPSRLTPLRTRDAG